MITATKYSPKRKYNNQDPRKDRNKKESRNDSTSKG